MSINQVQTLKEIKYYSLILIIINRCHREVFQNCDDYVIINIFKGIILKLKKYFPIMKTINNTIQNE